MLDQFLETLYQAEKKADARQEMVDAFMNFPKEELHKIAAGRVKLAYHGDGDWLEKFKGSPLYDQALALEEQGLQLDIEEQQKRLARKAERETEESTWDAKDAICLKKRMLDLELVKSQGGEAQAPAQPMDAPTMNLGESEVAPGPDKISSVNIFYGQRRAALEKAAACMRKAAGSEGFYAGDALANIEALQAKHGLTPEAAADLYTKKQRTLGGVGLGISGGALGASLGLPIGEIYGPKAGLIAGGLGALAGGLGGAYGGAALAGNEADLMSALYKKRAAEAAAAKHASALLSKTAEHQETPSDEEKAKVLAAIKQKYPDLTETAKVGSLQFRVGVPFGQLTDLEKIAFLGAARGAINVFKSGLSKGVSKGALKAGYKATEAPGVMAGLKNVGHYGANWAKTNPGTAAGLAGGVGLGAGVLAHKALSD